MVINKTKKNHTTNNDFENVWRGRKDENLKKKKKYENKNNQREKGVTQKKYHLKKKYARSTCKRSLCSINHHHQINDNSRI